MRQAPVNLPLGTTAQQFGMDPVIPGALGWFDGPVLLSSQYPHAVPHDGVDAAAPAMSTFLAALSSSGIRGALIPGTYNINAELAPGGNLDLVGYGAVLSMQDGGTSTKLLKFEYVDNIQIVGLELDGNKDTWPSLVTEAKMNLWFRSCSNIFLKDIKTHHARGDGLYFSRPAVSDPPCTNVVCENVDSSNNHRQALSITAMIHGRFAYCTFRETAGTAPNAGIDIEPNVNSDAISDIDFVACSSRDNDGAGLSIPWRQAIVRTATQRGVRWIGGDLSGNAGPGVIFRDVDGLTVIGARIEDNDQNGIDPGSLDANTVNERILIDGNIIRNNGRAAVGGQNQGTLRRVKIINNFMGMNARLFAGLSTYAEITLGKDTGNTTLDDVLVAGNSIGEPGGLETALRLMQINGGPGGTPNTFTNVRIHDNDMRNLYPATGASLVLGGTLIGLEEFARNAGANLPLTSKSTNYTALIVDEVIDMDATAGNRTITLHAANRVVRRLLTLRRTNAGANTVTVTAAGSDTIDGAASKLLGSQWASLTLKASLASWQIVSIVGTVT